MYQKTEPLWQAVYKKLRADIDEGKLKENDVLPNELELADKYNVSRITVRSALAKLSDDGLIKRVKGKGTIIQGKKIAEPLIKIKGFTQEMEMKGLFPGTFYAKYEKKAASGYIAGLFQKNLSTKFNVIERVRTINDTKIGYFVTYITPDISLPEDSKVYYSSLYEMLKRKGYTVNRIKQTIGAELADKNTADMLDMVKGEAVIVMKRLGYSDGRLIEFSICKYDAKRYEYDMEISD